jgi:hypothetical protein
MQHGQGRLELPNGRVKEGIFRKNKYIGSPRQRSKSPSRSEKLIQAILEQKDFVETNEEKSDRSSNTGSDSFYKNETFEHKDAKALKETQDTRE